MGVSSAAGDNRAIDVVEASLSSPLFGGASIVGAKNVLINFAVAAEGMLTIEEVNTAINRVQEFTGEKDENGCMRYADVIWGTSIKPSLEDKLEIIIVVTGFPSGYYAEAYSMPQQIVAKPAVAVVDTPSVAPVTPLSPVATPTKAGVGIVKPQNVGAAGSSTLDKHRRNYSNVHLSKSIPAFRARKVEFYTETVGRGKRAVEKVTDGQEQDSNAGASVQSLF